MSVRRIPEIARTTMTTITGFTGVVLAFSLVQAQGNLRNVEKTVANEAVQLNLMDRPLTNYGDAELTAIREAVRAYAEFVVADEWPQLSAHGSSQRTADLFRTLSHLIFGNPTEAWSREHNLWRSGENSRSACGEPRGPIGRNRSWSAADLLEGNWLLDGAASWLCRIRRTPAWPSSCRWAV